MALLLEFSTSEIKVLENFRKYTSVTKGIAPFFAYLILVVVNDFTVTIIIINIICFIFLICSYFFINDSIRWHYEYCEWKDLTIIIRKLFDIKNDPSIKYKNLSEFEQFKFEEYKKMMGKSKRKTFFLYKNKFFSGVSIYNLFKQRVVSLKRDIRRNREIIIKKDEIRVNPLILYICLTSNRVFNKSKYLFLMLLTIIYCQVHFVEKEFVKMPFLKLSDLYIDKYNNYIINCNYFILCLVTFFSNYFYYAFHKINCFKILLFISLIVETILLILYHFKTDLSEDLTFDLNQMNFSMLEFNTQMNASSGNIVLILVIYFFLNGINFYINVLILKLSKTLYRCTLFGFNSFISLSAFAFGEGLNYQIEHYFLVIGSFNIIGILTILYFGELKTIPYIINDLKQNFLKEYNEIK